MVFCSINGCQSKIGRDKVSFYGIPAILTRQCEVTMELSERRRKMWFERIYRPGFDESEAPPYVRVCAKHFVNGKPSALFDVANADWAPCINLGKTHCGSTRKGQLKRNVGRQRKGKSSENVDDVSVINIDGLQEEAHHNQSGVEGNENAQAPDHISIAIGDEIIPSAACQTDITCEGFARLEALYKKVLEENISLRRELATLKSLVGGPTAVLLDGEPSVTDDASANSDNEGPIAGLEKVEVILNTEPDPDSVAGVAYSDSDPLAIDEVDDVGGTSRDTSSRTPSALRPCRNEGTPSTDGGIAALRETRRQRNGNPHSVRDQDRDDPEDRESESESDEPAPRRRKSYQQKRNKRYPCAECGQKFISNQALEIHQRTHTGERPFECPVCQRGFSVMSTLKSHMRIHTGERPFACTMCPRRFSEHGTLKCHMRTHTGEKPYECHVCHKKFSENSTLRRHLLTHTGERPFECATCHSKFIQKYNLNNHIRRVHKGAALGL